MASLIKKERDPKMASRVSWGKEIGLTIGGGSGFWAANFIGGPSSFLATGDVLRYFLIGTVFNVIRILALGIMIGWLYGKLHAGARS